MKKSLVPIVGLMAALPSLAAEGAVPVWEPMDIHEPGHYVLTRSIYSDEPRTIGIHSGDVVLDLNGFTVGNLNPEQGIAIEFLLGDFPIRNVTIRNGVLRSACRGIMLDTAYHDVGPVRIRGLSFETEKEGIYSIGHGVERLRAVENEFTSGPTGSGIFLISCKACEISRNLVRDGGEGIFSGGNGSRIEGNVISDVAYYGVDVGGDNNLVWNNTITNCGADGLYVWGTGNHVERNVLIGNSGYGLNFLTGGNVYRGNTARGNAGTGCAGTASGSDFCDGVSGNTSHGDNYMPNQM
jgi:parallel beta-helix repeat protein